MDQLFSANQTGGLLNQLYFYIKVYCGRGALKLAVYLKKDSVEQTDFLHAVIDLKKLKVTFIVFGWDLLKMGMTLRLGNSKIGSVSRIN